MSRLDIAQLVPSLFARAPRQTVLSVERWARLQRAGVHSFAAVCRAQCSAHRKLVSRPRIRYLKPELWQSRDFQALTPIGRLTFVALICNADDQGRLKTDAAHLARNYVQDVPVDEINGQLERMDQLGMITTYSARSSNFIALKNWEKHQKVSHPSDGGLPTPPKFKKSKGEIAQTELDFLGSARENSRPRARRQTRSGPDPSSVRSVHDHTSSSNGSLVALTEAQQLVVKTAEEAAELCANLSDALETWGAKGDVTTRWLLDAEKLLRVDKRSLDEALDVLNWATHDDFWRPNIRSVAKFRKQYDTLRGQMMRRPQTAAGRLEQSIEGDLETARQLKERGL